MPSLSDMTSGAVQRRSATVESLDVEARELLVKCCPYGEAHDIGGGIVEEFAAGAFARAVKGPHRLGVWSEHGGPLVGRGLEAEDRADGFWLRARLGRTQAAQDLATMLEDKLLTDASVEFVVQPAYMDVRRDGETLHVRHRRAHLRGVAITFEGAYGGSAYVAELREAEAERALLEARAWLTEYRARAL